MMRSARLVDRFGDPAGGAPRRGSSPSRGPPSSRARSRFLARPGRRRTRTWHGAAQAAVISRANVETTRPRVDLEVVGRVGDMLLVESAQRGAAHGARRRDSGWMSIRGTSRDAVGELEHSKAATRRRCAALAISSSPSRTMNMLRPARPRRTHQPRPGATGSRAPGQTMRASPFASRETLGICAEEGASRSIVPPRTSVELMKELYSSTVDGGTALSPCTS